MKGKKMFIVGTKIKERGHELNVNSGQDFLDALDREVARMLERAVERAKDNGRKTLKAHDL